MRLTKTAAVPINLSLLSEELSLLGVSMISMRGFTMDADGIYHPSPRPIKYGERTVRGETENFIAQPGEIQIEVEADNVSIDAALAAHDHRRRSSEQKVHDDRQDAKDILGAALRASEPLSDVHIRAIARLALEM